MDYRACPMKKSLYIQFALVGFALITLFVVALQKPSYVEVRTKINLRTDGSEPAEEEAAKEAEAPANAGIITRADPPTEGAPVVPETDPPATIAEGGPAPAEATPEGEAGAESGEKGEANADGTPTPETLYK